VRIRHDRVQVVLFLSIFFLPPRRGGMKKSQSVVVGTRQRVGEYFVGQNLTKLRVSPYFHSSIVKIGPKDPFAKIWFMQLNGVKAI